MKYQTVTIEDASPIIERHGSIRIEANRRDRGWEIDVLDEDTPLGMSRLLYTEQYPDMSRSQAQVAVTMAWLNVRKYGV